MNWIWESIVLIAVSLILLRFAGRKSVAQMTIATTVVMISFGNILVQPIVNNGIGRTIAVMVLFIVILVLLEFLQLRSSALERIITGKSVTVISDGQPNRRNLDKLRMTYDRLEMRLRQQGVSKMSDVKTATIEPNGMVGYELMPDAAPLTLGDFKRLMKMARLTMENVQTNIQSSNMFNEVSNADPNTPDKPH